MTVDHGNSEHDKFIFYYRGVLIQWLFTFVLQLNMYLVKYHVVAKCLLVYGTHFIYTLAHLCVMFCVLNWNWLNQNGIKIISLKVIIELYFFSCFCPHRSRGLAETCTCLCDFFSVSYCIAQKFNGNQILRFASKSFRWKVDRF